MFCFLNFKVSRDWMMTWLHGCCWGQHKGYLWTRPIVLICKKVSISTWLTDSAELTDAAELTDRSCWTDWVILLNWLTDALLILLNWFSGFPKIWLYFTKSLQPSQPSQPPEPLEPPEPPQFSVFSIFSTPQDYYWFNWLLIIFQDFKKWLTLMP